MYVLVTKAPRGRGDPSENAEGLIVEQTMIPSVVGVMTMTQSTIKYELCEYLFLRSCICLAIVKVL